MLLPQFWVIDEIQCAGSKVEEVEAGFQGHHRTAFFTQGQRSYGGGHGPALHVRAVGCTAHDMWAHAVDPVKPLLCNIPQRPFTQRIGAVHTNAHVDHRSAILSPACSCIQQRFIAARYSTIDEGKEAQRNGPGWGVLTPSEFDAPGINGTGAQVPPGTARQPLTCPLAVRQVNAL